MFTSLEQFYNSDEWKATRAKIIDERKDEYGFVRCEHSGVILNNSYEIIAHHKTPLTMDNVNDFNISLNPSNIMLVSHKAHNEIHNRFGHSAGRKVYYVYGAPCSGKTTFVNSIKGNSDLICDIDNIWQCITGGARYDKPNALKTNVFEVQRCILDMIKRRVGNWERAYIIDGGAAKTPRNNRINDLRAEPIFIDTDRETCLKRLATDNNRTQAQRVEWVKYIDKWFNEYQA
jgi:hypothetical protein